MGYCSTLECYREEESCLITQSRMLLSKITDSTGYRTRLSYPNTDKSQSSPSLLNCRFDRSEKLRRPGRHFPVTRHAFLTNVLDDVML